MQRAQPALESSRTETAKTLKASDNQRELKATLQPHFPVRQAAAPFLPPREQGPPSHPLICQKGARSRLGRAGAAGRGQRDRGGSPSHSSSPANIILHRRGASKMEGNVCNLKPQLHFRSWPGRTHLQPRQQRHGPTRRRGGRGRGTRPGAQEPRPTRRARPARPAGLPPAPRRLRRGERGVGTSAHLLRTPAGTRTAPGELLSSYPAAVPRARHCRLSRSRAPRSRSPGARPPGPALSSSRSPSLASQGSHWALGLLNSARRCRLVLRHGASARPAPPCVKARDGGKRIPVGLSVVRPRRHI